MSAAGTGALLGFGFAIGVLLVAVGLPRARRPRLTDRLGPYLGRPELSRGTIGAPLRRVNSFRAAGRGLLGRFAGWLDWSLGGAPSIRRRLTALGSDSSVEEFRAEQVFWAGAGLVVGVVAGGLLGAARGGANPLAVLVLGGTGLVAGALGRDWWLSADLRRRDEALRTELPVIAELLALAVTAGESPAAALRRVCRVSEGELGRELARTLAESRSGAGLSTALENLAARTTLEPLVRFVDGIVIALERGTPLAEVLRAQAADAREAGKRALLATGGRREIAMMVPVVFLILPVTVLFALYPGLVSITMLTS
jgi:tight adherence protein C